MTTLTFQNTTLSVINQQNEIWFSISDVANALGYKETNGVTRLYNAHQDEFTPNMTILVDMKTNGGIQKVRIFSLRGAHLVGMLSQTKVAKDFRKWVLDILDREISQNQQQISPLEKEFHLTHTNDDLKAIAWTWYEAYRMAAFLKRIEPALRALQSPFAAEAYSMGHEYGWHIENTAKLIHRITQGVDYGNRPTPAVHLEKVLKPKPKAVKHYDF